ncbi:hypothetical protein [Methanosphaera sp. BMS]|uniref:hypothetical protein n=1 Tax=Methanosphaera sp. BMS TaxID=1789762 RepID=UPI000DC1D176|nr:hypothetical protein [Methanosphaera sp. BMS]AWX31997.1 hypothetical protein AW729_02300 [Methanosphaera sp. BMS]
MSPVVIVGVDFATVVVIVSDALSYLLVPVYTVIIFISSPFIPVGDVFLDLVLADFFSIDIFVVGVFQGFYGLTCGGIFTFHNCFFVICWNLVGKAIVMG